MASRGPQNLSLAVVLALAFPAADARAAEALLAGAWVLDSSIVTYHVTHPLKRAEGTSLAAKGKGHCDADGRGEFLVAIPVKTFASGNSNRDLHMLETVRGATFPLVVARLTLDTATRTPTGTANVEFAGESHPIPLEQVEIVPDGLRGCRVRLVIPLSLAAFKIERPRLLTVPIDDRVPVSIDARWSRAQR